MYDHLGPPNVPEPGSAELDAVKHRARVRQRNLFLLGAGSGAGAMAIIALLVIALVTGGSNTKDLNTVGRPDQTTTTSIAPSTTVVPSAQTPAAAPSQSGTNGRRSAPRPGAASASPPPAQTSLVAYVANADALTAQFPGAMYADIHVVNLDGSNDHTLARIPLNASATFEGMQWSPDGRTLGVAVEQHQLGASRSLHLIDLSGDDTGSIPLSTQVGAYAWAPTSDRLAVERCSGSQACPLTLVDTASRSDNGQVDKLSTSVFTWQRNGRLAGNINGSDGNGIYSVEPDNSDLRTLATLGDGVTGLVSGRGGALYYSTRAAGLNVVTDSETSHVRHVADNAIAQALSPDEKLIAWAENNQTGGSELFEVNTGDGSRRILGAGTCPAFAADGHLLFGESDGIWISDGDGRNPKRLVPAPAAACPAVTPSS